MVSTRLAALLAAPLWWCLVIGPAVLHGTGLADRWGLYAPLGGISTWLSLAAFSFTVMFAAGVVIVVAYLMIGVPIAAIRRDSLR
jgi:hypothetical protein